MEKEENFAGEEPLEATPEHKEGEGRRSMEENAEIQGKETKGEGGGKAFLVYLALAFGIVALILSFWNMGLHKVVGVLEQQGKVIEHRQAALEKSVASLKARALLSQLQLEAQRVYDLTMGDNDYEAAAKVVDSMEGQLQTLKDSFGEGKLHEMETLVSALKAEVARGPSPIPALISRIQLTADKIAGASTITKVRPQEAAPAEEAPAPKPKEEAIPKKERTQVSKAPEGQGVLWDILRFLNNLGGKIVGK